MRVYIGPYKGWVGPYQIAEKILFWMDKDEDRRVHNFGRWLAENKHGEDSYLAKLCDWIHSKRDRKIKVRIDNYDTWSMDHTLAYIILPMLKQLKATKHGSPYVDQEDIPEELRLTEREKLVHDNGYYDKSLNASEEEIEAVSEKFHAQWDWIMDQMIYSFEQQFDEEDGRNHYYDPYLPGEEPEEIKETVIDEDGNEVPDSKPLFTREWQLKMGKYNKEKHKVYEAKKQLGFTLFGKYFQNLWD